MARKRTGTITKTRKGLWQIVVTFRGKRVRLPALPRGTSKTKARDQAAYWAGEAERRESEGLGLDGKPLPPIDSGPPKLAGSMKGEGAEWFERWLAERKRRGYSRVRNNATHVRLYLLPVIGPRHPREWTTDDMRAVVRLLDDKAAGGTITAKTAANAWTTVRAACKAACASKNETLRCRGDNPATGVLGPDRGVKKSKTFLYPSEFARLVACSEVPLKWRRIVAVATYTAMRAGELRVLEWDDVDLTHGRINVHRSLDHDHGTTKATKSKRARHVVIEPALLPLLQAMHEEAVGAGRVLDLPSVRTMARALRRWLLRAGVDRADLHTSDATRKPLTFHDCRGTGLTWAAVRGDSPWVIKERAGHASLATTEGYVRLGEQLRAGFGEPFPELPGALIGEAAEVESITETYTPAIPLGRAGDFSHLRRGGRDSNPRPPA